MMTVVYILLAIVALVIAFFIYGLAPVISEANADRKEKFEFCKNSEVSFQELKEFHSLSMSGEHYDIVQGRWESFFAGKKIFFIGLSSGYLKGEKLFTSIETKCSLSNSTTSGEWWDSDLEMTFGGINLHVIFPEKNSKNLCYRIGSKFWISGILSKKQFKVIEPETH